DHAVATDPQDVDAVLGVEHRLQVQLLAVLDGFDGGAGGDVAQQGELGGALLVGEAAVSGDLQRASLVLVAAQDPLLFQGADAVAPKSDSPEPRNPPATCPCNLLATGAMAAPASSTFRSDSRARTSAGSNTEGSTRSEDGALGTSEGSASTHCSTCSRRGCSP